MGNTPTCNHPTRTSWGVGVRIIYFFKQLNFTTASDNRQVQPFFWLLHVFCMYCILSSIEKQRLIAVSKERWECSRQCNIMMPWSFRKRNNVITVIQKNYIMILSWTRGTVTLWFNTSELYLHQQITMCYKVFCHIQDKWDKFFTHF